MRVLKFGGKSLHSVEEIDRLAKKISLFSDEKLIVVVSAMGDATSNLLKMAEVAGPNSRDQDSQRELDMLLGSGERVSAALFSLALQKHGKKSQSFTGSQAGVLTKGPHSDASIKEIKPIRIDESLKKGIIPVVAGFQGVDPDTKNITTLGRGGSDLTALFFAKHYGCKAELYKSVGGLFTADPNIVPSAKKINVISPEHLEAICHWGTKALFTKAAKLASEFNVSLTFHSDQSFETMTSVETASENTHCITRLKNIGAVVCEKKNISQGHVCLKKHFSSTPFRLLASAEDNGDSRFLLDFIDTQTNKLEFNDSIKPLSLESEAVSLVSSHELSDKLKERALKSVEDFSIKRLLESKRRLTFFVDKKDSKDFTNRLHQGIFEPSHDKK